MHTWPKDHQLCCLCPQRLQQEGSQGIRPPPTYFTA